MEHEHDEMDGDPRRCPRHGLVTSSNDGLHDAPCGMCELEMDMDGDDEPAVPESAPIPVADDAEQLFGDDDIPF